MTDLFTPGVFGALSLANRVVMAPLTRMRAGEDGVPREIGAEHYGQRASVGLIVSEGTYPSKAGQGFMGQPGLVTDEQVAAWRRVTDAVHDAGGQIVAQVMHAGRVSHPGINGGLPIEAPSAIAVEGVVRTPEGKVPFPVPHALTTAEAREVIASFVVASRRAIEAGFDGIELHSANGYLLHQFLAPNSNVRDDVYGGSPENRARFVVETAQAVAEAIGADRVGIRISPSHDVQGTLETDEADRAAVYGTLIDGISALGLAYLSILHADPTGEFVQGLRRRFTGPVIINTGFGTITTREEAREIVEGGFADAVAIGRPVIANPDLVRRWREDRELNELDPTTIYAGGHRGYTDYPMLDAVGATP